VRRIVKVVLAVVHAGWNYVIRQICPTRMMMIWTGREYLIMTDIHLERMKRMI
jgi:hypothetical protein